MIPPLNADGFLPVGIFECTLSEIRARFGAFKGSDQRPRLFARLEDFTATMQGSGLFESLLEDGSFVTAKVIPNDIDLVATLRPGHDFERDLPMSEYILLSRTLLRRRFGFDVIVAERDSSLYTTYIEFFSHVRERPDARKGLLKILL
jgi:hypothetical protein